MPFVQREMLQAYTTCGWFSADDLKKLLLLSTLLMMSLNSI